MDLDLDIIIIRIQKLIALSTSSNIHEAALAASKAQELMFRYNLSLIEISRIAPDNQVASTYENQTVNLDTHRALINWRREFIGTIARYNFCRVVLFDAQPRISIIGKSHNIIAVINLFEYLTEAIIRLADGGWEDAKRSNDGHGPLRKKPTPWAMYENQRTWKNGFYLGAVRTIEDRLRVQFEQSSHANAESSSLVVIADQELEDALHRFFPHLVSVSMPSSESEGYIAGREAGKQIGLEQQLANDNESKTLPS